MNREQAAWAAGLFEGEGSIFCAIQKSRSKSHNTEYKYPRMTLKMTDEDVVMNFYRVVGCGDVYPKPSGKTSWKPSWQWQLTTRSEIERLYESFKPFLGRRRLEKFEEVLA